MISYEFPIWTTPYMDHSLYGPLPIWTTPYMDHFFKEHFRMNKATFRILCDLVSPQLEKQTTRLREPVPLPIRVAIGLRRLGKGDTFESLSAQFGVGKSPCNFI